MAWRVLDGFFIAQRHHRSLGAARHGAAHVGLRRSPRAGWGERMRATGQAWQVLVLFLLVLGGIYLEVVGVESKKAEEVMTTPTPSAISTGTAKPWPMVSPPSGQVPPFASVRRRAMPAGNA